MTEKALLDLQSIGPTDGVEPVAGAKPVGPIGKRKCLFKIVRRNDLHFRIGASQMVLGEIKTEAVFERHQNIHDLPPMV